MPLVEIIGGGILPFTAPSAGPVLTNLVAWYKFDDGSGQVLTDHSGLGNHGQLGSTAGVDTNDPAWGTGRLGFDGVDDYVDLPLAAFAGEFTISVVFVIPTGSPASQTLVGGTTSTQGILWQNTPRYVIRVLEGGASAVTSSSSPVDVWEMVTLTRNAANKIDFYVNDGAALRLYADAAQAGNALFDILGRRLASTAPFAGEQAGALYYDRAITEAENAENYAYWQSELAGRGIALS